LDDVKVVEQPFTRRADVEVLIGGGGEPRVRLVEKAARVVEPCEQGRMTTTPAGSRDALGRRDGTSPIGEVLGSEQLAANRARQQLFGGAPTAGEKPGKESWGSPSCDDDDLGMGTARVPDVQKSNDSDCLSCLVRLYFASTTTTRPVRLEGGPVPEVPYRVDKPWGYELVWALTDRYVGKILHVKAGHILSLQYHNRKDETMHVLSGELILRTRPGSDLMERALKRGESVHIPPRLIHQIEAVVDSDVLEASTSDLDDLVRLEDRYGRS
jgi:mannose-6-phosphate isomerase